MHRYPRYQSPMEKENLMLKYTTQKLLHLHQCNKSQLENNSKSLVRITNEKPSVFILTTEKTIR